jgi:hypothetical protein
MTSSAHDTGWYNVQGSLDAWLTEALTTYKPALVPSVTIVYQSPEQPLTPPCWSVTFLGVVPMSQPAQGRYVGDGLYGERKAGIMEVSCWVTRKNTAWAAQLAQMADAVYCGVLSTMQLGSAVIIRDFYTNAVTPAATGYRIVIEGAEDRNPPADPNPDIERRRIIITFNWVQRV